MEKNIGTWDRIVRIVIGIFSAFLGYKYNFAFFVITAFTFYEAFESWCLFYQMLGINTCKDK